MRAGVSISLYIHGVGPVYLLFYTHSPWDPNSFYFLFFFPLTTFFYTNFSTVKSINGKPKSFAEYKNNHFGKLFGAIVK